MVKEDPNLYYREVQRNHWFLRAAVIVFSILAAAAIINHVFFSGNFGGNPSRDVLLILLGIVIVIVLPLVVHLASVVIEVRSDGIHYDSNVLFRKTSHKISLDNLDRYEKRIGTVSNEGRVFPGFGDFAVQLDYAYGETIWIGTIAPEKMIDAIDAYLKHESAKVFYKSLSRIQPSQLYIDAEKLARIVQQFNPPNPELLEPIPIKQLGEDIIFTDGHTRAFAAYFSGLSRIRVYWEEDDLDWEAYQICVDWCKKENIRTIADLRHRVVNPADYEKLWHDRCRKMQDELEENRRGEKNNQQSNLK